MENRRLIRAGLKVIHPHSVGGRRLRRVSELLFIDGRPFAVLGWIDSGRGLRTPLKLALERTKLRPGALRGTFHYEGETADPRFQDLKPLPGRVPADARARPG